VTTDPQRSPVTGEHVALDLVNTTFVHGGRHGHRVDVLASPGQLAAWLAEHAGELGADVVDAIAAEGAASRLLGPFRELRADLRAVFAAAVTGAPLPPGAVGSINAAARDGASWLELSAGPPPQVARRWPTRDQGAIAMARVAAAALELLGDAARTPVRACPAPGCILFFVAGPQRRTWCSAGCGNRVRVARHDGRRRAASEG